MVEISPSDSEEDIQEKLKSMSPEELKEFQKKQCIFCQIISGKVASKKIYSDEVCTAILDINPANPGHVLLIPTEHYAIMPLIPENEIAHMFMVAKAISNAILKGLKVEGANIFVANGMVAGQKAQHFMIHVIPRKEGDGVGLDIPEKKMNDSDAKEIVKKLKPFIAKAFGAKAGEEESEKDESPEEDEGPEEEIYEEPEEETEEEKPKKKSAKNKQAKKSKKKAEKKKPAKKAEKPKEKKEVGLDDIANLLTGGGA